MARRALGALLLLALGFGLAVLLAPVASADRALTTSCGSLCKAQPRRETPTPTTAASATPDPIVLPSASGSFAPTATAVPVHTPKSTPGPPLPAGAAPELANATASPGGLLNPIAITPTGGTPTTKNPLGPVVLVLLLGFAVLAAVSTGLFFRLR